MPANLNTVRLTNQEAVEAHVGFAALMDKPLPVKKAMAIAEIMAQIESQVKRFAIVRDSLFKKYNLVRDKDEHNQEILRCTEEGKEQANMEGFQKDFEILLEDRGSQIEFKLVMLPEDLAVEPSVVAAIKRFIG